MNVYRKSILMAGVKNLKEYGYPNVNEDNILTDAVYKEFFKVMLKDNLGKIPSVDPTIKKLLKEIE